MNEKLKYCFLFVTLLCVLFIILDPTYFYTYNFKLEKSNNAKDKIINLPENLNLNGVELNDKNRVLCIIMTSEKTFMKRSVMVWNTWAKKCHKAIFPCNCRNLTNILETNNKTFIFKNLQQYKEAIEVPIWQLNMTEHYDRMAEKVFNIIKLVYENYHDEFKWFLLTDDDTFIFVDNLYSFIKDKSYDNPLTYGYNFKTVVPKGYHSGGAGVLYTHESLRRIYENIKKGVCNSTDGYGDVAIGYCAYLSNVTMGNSLDRLGRERFHPLDFTSHHVGRIPEWLHKYSSNGVKIGDKCCSEESISFHYTSPKQMRFFANLLNPKLLNNIYNLF